MDPLVGESRPGLAPVHAPKATLIAYATSPGRVASDGRGRNGAYIAALLQRIATSDRSIESMFVINVAKGYGCTSNEPFSGEHVANSLSPEPGFPYFFRTAKKKSTERLR